MERSEELTLCFSSRRSLLIFRQISDPTCRPVYRKVPAVHRRCRDTAQAVLPRGNKKYIVSFITFAPVDDPQVLLYVVVDEPNAEEQADSKYPQYIAQGILSELLPYLNVTPDESEDGTIPKEILWTYPEAAWMQVEISQMEMETL